MKKYKIKVVYEGIFEGIDENDAFDEFVQSEIDDINCSPMNFIIENIKQEEI